jgi:hypothetical protein
MGKLSSVLKDRLETAKPDDWVDVVLELTGPSALADLPSDRRERYAAVDQVFASSNKDVIEAIQDTGGQVLDKSWLSSAIKARVQAHNISRLLSLDHVELIDLPHRLTRG